MKVKKLKKKEKTIIKHYNLSNENEKSLKKYQEQNDKTVKK